MDNIKFPGIHITSDLAFSTRTTFLVKKALQRFFFLRKFKRTGLFPQFLTMVWYGICTAQDRKDLTQLVKTAQGIVGRHLPHLQCTTAWFKQGLVE